MFSFSLLRPANPRLRRDHSPFSSTYAHTRSPDASRTATQRKRRWSSRLERQRLLLRHEQEGDMEDEEDDPDDEDGGEAEEEDDEEDPEEDDEHDLSDEDEDGPEDAKPLLPIFSAAHLDAIPVFALTHTIRMLVSSRCDTVLSWEQLRSPQISAFLVKPIEQEIRSSQLNAATHYALMANCLQYGKEAAISSGNSGTNNTRAMVCELLAIKLLKDFSTRELIDALSYDFDPLQGQLEFSAPGHDERRTTADSKKQAPRPARISCFEIAIRASSKRFLSHPMVVKQLEAIWAGTIVFHSAADSLHRQLPPFRQLRNYGTNDGDQPAKANLVAKEFQLVRRTVTLYDPRDASLFKLSRLRVPRYRNILSTMSFAVLLGLFLAVLVERSLEITTLEVIFWFWAAGFMLDEIVGFNEQGFSLYLASFWNTFDLGILLILLAHLALRVYGIVMPDVKKRMVANMAYDVLAADAILLFPRLFSVLDHYRYFSPLLIGFRYMVVDLVAVTLLIAISCSGFFVALTLSFGNDGIDTPSSVAYALLQMVMGFTPAAWDRWAGYNILGKTILTLFLFICHFLVVTILVTVLTNSFMAIVRNANEEHQFLFAVNTISHVKSDALFSYVAPTNILQWLLVPVRYLVPFRQYVKINRTIIKITHLPLLFTIYLYEKTVLQATVFDSLDLVERRGRPKRSTTSRLPLLNRAPSIATFRQDRALEEVFRQPFDSTMRSVRQGRDRRKASNVVNTWMRAMGDDIGSPPPEQDRGVVDRLEGRSSSARRPRGINRKRDFSRRTMSVVSDPEEFAANVEFLSPGEAQQAGATPSPMQELSQPPDADGDDELRADDDGDEETTTFENRSTGDQEQVPNTNLPSSLDYLTAKQGSLYSASGAAEAFPPARVRATKVSSRTTSPPQGPSPKRPRHHSRNVSTATMIFKPVLLDSSTDQSSSVRGAVARVTKAQQSASGSGSRTPVSKPGSNATGHRTPRRPAGGPSKMRPILPGKETQAFRSTPNLAGLVDVKGRPLPRRKPSLEMDLISDIGDNRAIGGGYVGALPTSFAAQMARGLAESRHVKEQKDDQELLAKIMMARMNSLEEGFREVIHEMRESLRHDEGRSMSRGRAGRADNRKERLGGKAPNRIPIAGGDKENVDPTTSVEADGDVAAEGKRAEKVPQIEKEGTESQHPSTSTFSD